MKENICTIKLTAMETEEKTSLSSLNIGIKLIRFKSDIKPIEDIPVLECIMEFQFIHNNIFRIFVYKISSYILL